MRPALHCVSNVGPHHTDDNSRRETAGDGSGRLISTQRSQWFCADVCADESSKGGLQGIQCGHRPSFSERFPAGLGEFVVAFTTLKSCPPAARKRPAAKKWFHGDPLQFAFLRDR